MSSWELPEVAEAQAELAYGELDHFHKGRPFTYFSMALSYIYRFDKTKLIDLGCGAGHYGEFIGRMWPDIRYTGIDSSKAMIEVAKKKCTNPKAEFYFLDADEYVHYLYFYEVALHSQALEYTEDPRQSYYLLLQEGPSKVILHKIRFTKDRSVESGWITEGTYCGHEERIWLWNEAELVQMVRDSRRTVWKWIHWPGENIATWLVA